MARAWECRSLARRHAVCRVGKSVRRSSTSEGGSVASIQGETADGWWARRRRAFCPSDGVNFKQHHLRTLVMPRHWVSPSASPMTGSGGASSTPRLLGSIIEVSGILVHPPSRVMTAGMCGASHSFAISQHVARGFAINFSPSDDQRAQGMPGARCARSRAWCVESTRVSHHGHTGKRPAFPAQWLTAYSALSPGTGLFCPRHP